MTRILSGLILTVALVGFTSAVAQARCSDPRVPEVRAQISAACPCTGNHGQYVSCVAHHVRDAVQNGDIDTNCKGAVTRCAARSTCGKKDGFVTCARCNAGTCESGLCDDGFTVCADSSQCPPVLNHCSVKSTAEACEAKGGVVGSGSCCDAVCVASPGGAFVD